jgi:hypothetical protein
MAKNSFVQNIAPGLMTAKSNGAIAVITAPVHNKIWPETYGTRKAMRMLQASPLTDVGRYLNFE